MTGLLTLLFVRLPSAYRAWKWRQAVRVSEEWMRARKRLADG